MLESARMPFTILLLAFFREQLPESDQALLAGSVKLGKALMLLPGSLSGSGFDQPILLVEFRTMIVVIALDDGNLFEGEHWHPASNIVVGAATIEVGHEILHGDAAGRKLKSAPAIYNGDFLFHDI